MKTTITAISLLFASMSVTAMPSHGLDVSVDARNGAAIIEVLRDGQPVEGANVSAKNFSQSTNENGTTFFNLLSKRSQYVDFTITDDQGNTETVRKYVPRDRS
ncbi:hypothetical protein GCE9029_02535 [Grimontia celer]|uniref:Nickel uptake substrate-specific transmembrane region n=1 Tax=Grimontia celer TaxID=1796497 RepID=A0A128F3G7_9GAMM|nr:hypothetical protein [Grimontia celer]CZF81319.1 hypothetical protein GCE9029_02535 [Grimontia celer]